LRFHVGQSFIKLCVCGPAALKQNRGEMQKTLLNYAHVYSNLGFFANTVWNTVCKQNTPYLVQRRKWKIALISFQMNSSVIISTMSVMSHFTQRIYSIVFDPLCPYVSKSNAVRNWHILPNLV